MAQQTLVEQAKEIESVHVSAVANDQMQYSRQDLETCTRPELWDICRQKNLKCFPKSIDCIEAILYLQSAKIADAETKSIEAIAAQPHKKVIQPQRNPDALFSFALDYQPPNHGGPEGDRGTGTR